MKEYQNPLGDIKGVNFPTMTPQGDVSIPITQPVQTPQRDIVQEPQDVPVALPEDKPTIDNYGVKSVEYREDGEIKEVEALLSTEELGYCAYTTEPINGCLESVIIDTNGSINVMISLDKFTDIKLFNTKNNYIHGSVYLPLRVSAISPEYEKFNFQTEKWTLSDRLICEIVGTKNTNIKIILRYK